MYPLVITNYFVFLVSSKLYFGYILILFELIISLGVYLQELFSDMGFLLECNIIRTGLAIVTYRDRAAAIQAIDYYDKRKLDGKPMRCKMMDNYHPKSRSNRYLINYIFFSYNYINIYYSILFVFRVITIISSDTDNM